MICLVDCKFYFVFKFSKFPEPRLAWNLLCRQEWMTLIFWFSCLCILNASVTHMHHHHTRLYGAKNQTWGFMCARQVIFQLSHISTLPFLSYADWTNWRFQNIGFLFLIKWILFILREKLWLWGEYFINYNYTIFPFPLLPSVPPMPPTPFQIPGPFSLIVIVTYIYKTQIYTYLCV